METRDWTILKVLHEEKNITRTAELLYVSQPAMTKRLKQIESEFGVEIVHRSKRGVHFTPQGEYLAKCAGNILKQLQKIQNNLENMQDSIEGTLRIGASNFITRHKLPEILAGFKKEYPKVNFQVTNGWSNDIFDLIANQDVHVAFVRGDYDWQSNKELYLEETICIISAEPIEFSDLPKLQRIEYNKDYKLNELINDWWWGHYSEPPQVCMKVDRSDICREMVVKGLGYAILPSLVVEKEKNIYKVDLSDIHGNLMKRKTWLFYHQETLELKLVKAFVDFVKAYQIQ